MWKQVIVLVLCFLAKYSYAQGSCINIGCADMNVGDNSGSMVDHSCVNGTTMYTCNTYDKEYCHLSSSSPLSGVCKSNSTRFQFYPVEVAFPGERCDPHAALYECIYGYRSCSAYRCLGFLSNERCQLHQDCNPGLYCDSILGTCQTIKDLDNQCKDSADCGREAACIYVASTDSNGKCVQYFTYNSGVNFYAKSEMDTFV
jgi:hypothetical protein